MNEAETVTTPDEAGGLRRPCIRCGYELAGLPDDAKCPECAAPVSTSLFGDLCLAPRRTIQKMRTGARCVFWASVLTPLLLIALVVDAILSGPRPEEFYAVFAICFVMAIGNLWLIGWWKLTPRNPDDGSVLLRRKAGAFIRGLLILAFVSEVDALVAAAAAVIRRGWPPPSTTAILAALIVVGVACGVIVLFVALASIFAGLLHTRHLAGALPDRKLRVRAGRLLWLGTLVLLVECGVLATLGMIAEGHWQAIEFATPYLMIFAAVIALYPLVTIVRVFARLGASLRRLLGEAPRGVSAATSVA